MWRQALLNKGLSSPRRQEPRRSAKPTLEMLEDRLTPAVIEVTTFDDVTNDNDSLTSLREAIALAAQANHPGADTILLRAGTYEVSKRMDIMDPSGPVTIQPKDSGPVVLDYGSSAAEMLMVDELSEVWLRGLTITNNNQPTSAAVWNLGNTHIMDTDFVSNRSRAHFGAILNTGGTMTIQGGTFRDNSAPDGSGGAITNRNSGSGRGQLTIIGTQFIGNRASSGGAIMNFDANMVIREAIFTSNNADTGGAIMNDGGNGRVVSTALIDNVTFNNNSAKFGGAIANEAILDVFASRFDLNSLNPSIRIGSAADRLPSADAANFLLNGGKEPKGLDQLARGGGIANQVGGSLLVGNCTFTRNGWVNTNIVEIGVGYFGGGIFNSGAKAEMIECTISDNHTRYAGGGIFSSSPLVVRNSTISANSAAAGTFTSTGGAIYASASLTIANSTISGNSATKGGGLFVRGTAGAVIGNSTITANQASVVGGGVWSTVSLFIGNTIVAGNAAPASPDLLGPLVTHGHNLFGTGGSGLLFHSSDLVGVNPLLSPLQNNGGPTWTHALLPGSPAIDAGDNLSAPDTDQRGVARIQNGTIDIGAFESRGFTVVFVTGTPQQTLVNTPFAEPLKFFVVSAFGEPVAGGQITFRAPALGPTVTFGQELVLTLTNAGGVINGGGYGAAVVNAVANGTPGRYVVTASASGVASTAWFSLTNLNASPITLTPLDPILDHAKAGVLYSSQFSATGDPGPFTFAVTQGTLPLGLSLSADGLLAGTSPRAGTYSFQVTATSDDGACGSWYYTLTVVPAEPAALLLTGHVGISFLFPIRLQVTLVDAFGNVCTNYRGTIHFHASSHPAGGEAYLPADYTFTEADNGSHTFEADVSTAGLWTFVVYDLAKSTTLKDTIALSVT